MFKLSFTLLLFLSFDQTQGEWNFVNYHYSQPQVFQKSMYGAIPSTAVPMVIPGFVPPVFPSINPFNMFNLFGGNQGYATGPNQFYRVGKTQPLFQFPQVPALDPFAMAENMRREINEQVDKNLKPITQNMARESMMKGMGGVTIVTIPRLNLRVILSEGESYNCEGDIVKSHGAQPVCLGKLVPIKEVCIPGMNYIQFNNIKCFGEHVSIYNGVCINGQQMTLSALKERCGADYDTNNYAEYDYYPVKGKMHAINVNNPDIFCINPDKYHCIFN